MVKNAGIALQINRYINGNIPLNINIVASNVESQIVVEQAKLVGVTLIKSITLEYNDKILNKKNIQGVIERSDILLLIVDADNITQVNNLLKIAQVSKQEEILTLVIATTSFQWKYSPKGEANLVKRNIAKIKTYVDTILVIPLTIHTGSMTKYELSMYKYNLTADAIRVITEVLFEKDDVVGQVSFSDFHAVTSRMGEAMIGSGCYRGKDKKNRAKKATEMAIYSSSMDRKKLAICKSILVNIIAGEGFCASEFEDIGAVIDLVVSENASEDVRVIVGFKVDKKLLKGLRVTILATGISENVIKGHKKELIIPAFLRKAEI